MKWPWRYSFRNPEFVNPTVVSDSCLIPRFKSGEVGTELAAYAHRCPVPRDGSGRGYRRPDMRRSPQLTPSGSAVGPDQPRPEPEKVSEQLERWLGGDGDKTLGGLIDVFEEKSFAILFVLLLGVSALPLPTGGATHVFEIIAVLLALQLIAGRDQIWLPQRWRKLELAGDKQQRFITALMKMIRRLERFSRPRLRFLFDHRLSNIVFGLLVIGGSIGAFFAPPFTGLDTLPSLGVVLLSLSVLLEDFVLAVLALVVGAAGVVLEVVLGNAAVNGIGKLL